MSQENVELARRALEAFSRAGLDALLEYVHPDAEYDVSAVIGPYAGKYYGRAAIRNLLADYFDVWEDVRLEPEDLIEVGGDRVAVLLRAHFRGKGSGAEVAAQMTQVWTVRDGKVVQVTAYDNRAEALEAVGLSERAVSQENVEIARRGVEQYNRQFTSTQELDLDFLAPDVEFDNSSAALDAAVYRGHDGIRQFMSLVRGMWTVQTAEAEEFIPVGKDRVITSFRMVSVGRDNIEVTFRAATLVTVGGGKITHMKAFQSRADALEAVGLSGQGAHADS